MKLVTRFELATKSKDELHIILRELFNQLARAEINSHDNNQLVASVQNVKSELKWR